MRLRPRRRAVRARQKRRIRLETDARRAQLLELAKKEFSGRSYDEVSIDDLARAAKISKGLLYHYFPTKRDLYVAGLKEIANELVAAVLAVPDDLAPIDQIRMSLDAYFDYIANHGRAFVSLMRGGIGSDPEVASVVEDVRTRLYRELLSGSALASTMQGDARFETAMRGWIGFVEHTSLEWVANPRLARVELRELLTQILFEILRVVTTPPPKR